jgi:hypothetical protein
MQRDMKMKEIISQQLHNNLSSLLFYLGITLIPIIIISLTLTIRRLKIKELAEKLKIYFVLSVIMLMGLVSFIPVASSSINLVRDYNEQIILTKEGYVDKRLIKAKIPVIEIDDEQFTMSPKVGNAKVGEYCVIKYFKYSKYIYSLNIEEPPSDK